MSRLLRSLTIVLMLVAATFIVAPRAFAQVTTTTQTTRKIDPIQRRTSTPPPLSGPAAAAVITPQDQLVRQSFGNYRVLTAADFREVDVPRPVAPSIAELRKRHNRVIQSATGATIALTGDAHNFYVGDQTLAYDSNVYYQCSNMTPNTTYQYYVFPPRGPIYTLGGTFATGNPPGAPAGQTRAACGGYNGGGGVFRLSTPVVGGSAHSDPAYSAVWTIALHDTSKAAGVYETVVFTVVQSTQHFNTYSDSSLTTPATDFHPGDTVYVNTTGLNPSHTYNYGFLYTSGNGIPCTFSIPSGSGNVASGTCFAPGGTGTVPSGGAFYGQYTLPSSGINSIGTYSVELFDSTASEGSLVSTSQFSVQSAANVWCLQAYNGGTTQACSTTNVFAADGLVVDPTGAFVAEQSVTGAYLSMTGGLISGHVYSIALTNPNGVVYSTVNIGAGQPYFYNNPTVTAASANLPSTQYAFPNYIGTGSKFAAIGPSQIPFAPNIYTYQLYDQTANATVASKSFTIVGYNAADRWTTPNAAYATANAAGVATNVTATFTNNAGALFGTWNADGLKEVDIRQDSGAKVTLGQQLLVTTTTDSAGQTWNLTISPTLVKATPQVATQFLPDGATLPIPFTISTASGNCPSGCYLDSTITPFHGIAASGIDAVSNTLQVFGNAATPGSARSTYSLSFGTAASPLLAPRYSQASYISGTDGILAASSTAGSYPLSLTVNNFSGQEIEDILLTFPTSYDPNASNQFPYLQSPGASVILTPGGAVTQALATAATGTAPQVTNPWNVILQSSTNGTPHGTMNGNNPSVPYQVMLQQVATNSAGGTCTNSTASCKGIASGTSATFVITLPFLLNAFQFNQITATANSQAANFIKITGLTSFNMSAASANTNAIAGFTNLDSTEMAVFELEPSHMQSSFSPPTISTPQSGNIVTTLKFVNTPTSVNPNPEYVSELDFTVPTGAVPATITASSPTQTGGTWSVTSPSTGKFRVTLCASPAAVGTTVAANGTINTPACTAAQDVNAIAPGGELDMVFTYTTAQAPAPTTGSYNITWQAVGANGGATTLASAPSAFANLVIANTTAMVSFTNVGGYSGNPLSLPSAVTANTEPSIGSSSDATNGNGYVFHIFNNGTNVITGAKITVPYFTVSGQNGNDGGTPDTFWTLTKFTGQGSPTAYVSGVGSASPGTCSGYVPVTQVTSGVNGAITLTGCNIAVGKTIDVYFNALDPYLINNEFEFKTIVSSIAPAVPNGPTTVPYPKADYIKIIADVRLTLVIPPNGTGTVLPAQPGGSSPVTTCAGCIYSNSPGLLIDMGLLKNTLPLNSGTFTAADVLNAQVFQDTSTGWQLYVSVDNNPSVTGGRVSTQVSANTAAPGGYTRDVTTPTVLPVTGSGVYPTAGTGLNVSTFSGATRRAPIDNLMNYIINLSGSLPASPQNQLVTIYYTVIPN